MTKRNCYRHTGEGSQPASLRYPDGTTYTASLRDCRNKAAEYLRQAPSVFTYVKGRLWAIGDGPGTLRIDRLNPDAHSLHWHI